MTLHSVLRLIADDYEWTERDEVPIDTNFIIVDEVSMMDIKLVDTLFPRIKTSCRMLLLGDADQLLSVELGNIFRELLYCEKIPKTVLDVVYRQFEASNIVLNAAAIHKRNKLLRFGNDQYEDAPATANAVARIYMQEVK